jgi:hypothetical protein
MQLLGPWLGRIFVASSVIMIDFKLDYESHDRGMMSSMNHLGRGLTEHSERKFVLEIIAN